MASEGPWISPPKMAFDTVTNPRVASPEANTTSLPQYQVQRPEDPHPPPPHRPGMKTINFNITIHYPEYFWPRCRRRRDRDDSYRFRVRDGQPKHRHLLVLAKLLVALFYISFIICGSVAWHIRTHTDLYGLEVVPVILGTFSPFFDLFGNMVIVYLIKKDKERDQKKPRFGLAHLLILQYNICLVIMHIVILVYACAWKIDMYSSWNWPRRRDMSNLVIYNMVSMLAFKAVLALKVLYIWRAGIPKPDEYAPLARDEETRIGPGTVVDFSDDEQTPRQSEERVRLL